VGGINGDGGKTGRERGPAKRQKEVSWTRWYVEPVGNEKQVKVTSYKGENKSEERYPWLSSQKTTQTPKRMAFRGEGVKAVERGRRHSTGKVKKENRCPLWGGRKSRPN